MYIPAITMINQRYDGHNRIAANTALGFNGNLFAMFGTLLSGVAMDIWQPEGLMYALTTLVSIFLVFFVIQSLRKQLMDT